MADMAETDNDFKRMVRYFWTEKGDPTRYSGWNAKRCKALMPAFYEAWSQMRTYKALADLAAKEEGNVDTDPA